MAEHLDVHNHTERALVMLSDDNGTRDKKQNRLAHSTSFEKNYTSASDPLSRHRRPHIMPQQEFWLLACL